MPKYQWIGSALLLYHLVAVSVAAVPDPRRLPAVLPVTIAHDHLIPRLAAPVLDRIAAAVAGIHPWLFRSLAPIRTITQPYINAGVANQRWNMFSNPPPSDLYMRVDTWVLYAGNPVPDVFREVILPADDEQQVRFLYQFRDKALTNALEEFQTKRDDFRAAPPLTTAAARSEYGRVAEVMTPIARWARERVIRRVGGRGRAVRVEIWGGEAPNPVSGHEPPNLQARLAAIEPYHHGPAVVSSRPTARSRTDGIQENEADITWTLLLTQTPQ